MSSFKLIHRNLRGSALVITVLGLAGSVVQAQSSGDGSIVVVVSRSTEAPQFSVEQVSRIFLAQDYTLPNGALLIAVDAPDSSALYQDFYTKVLGKSTAQIKSYRARQSFTGAGVPPRQAATLVQSFKKDSKESPIITYIRKRDLNDQLQVVLDTGK
jgi:hypothetical protein